MDRLLWTQVLDMGPPLRRWTAMAYDNDRDRIVLFGGAICVPERLSDRNARSRHTWEFDGTIWIQMQDMGPPARSEHGMC